MAAREGCLECKRKFGGWKTWLAGGVILLACFAAGAFWLANRQARPKEAPEVEMVLSAQANLPFQVLIPAFLPGGFNRSQLQLDTSLTTSGGEPMIQLTYPTRQGLTLTLREWLADDGDTGDAGLSSTVMGGSQLMRCRCQCRSRNQCDLGEMEVRIDDLHVSFSVSAPNVLSMQDLQLIIKTLGPATNQQVYSAAEDVPLSYLAQPAVEVPINASGVQELTLVVTPQGYNPQHFSVKRGIPVRLIFRQLGQVGCGNELVIEWAPGKEASLVLESADDQELLEFTPQKSGDFLFHCPHMIYQGVMTVLD